MQSGRAVKALSSAVLTAIKSTLRMKEVEVLQERRSRIGPANDPFSSDPETKYGLKPDLPSRHKHMDAWNPLASGLAPQMLADSKLSRSIYRGYDVTFSPAGITNDI